MKWEGYEDPTFRKKHLYTYHRGVSKLIIFSPKSAGVIVNSSPYVHQANSNKSWHI